MQLRIDEVRHEPSNDTIVATMLAPDGFALFTVTLSIDQSRVSLSSEDHLPDLSTRQRVALPGAVAHALHEACTVDDEILYVPSETVLPLTITL